MKIKILMLGILAALLASGCMKTMDELGVKTKTTYKGRLVGYTYISNGNKGESGEIFDLGPIEGIVVRVAPDPLKYFGGVLEPELFSNYESRIVVSVKTNSEGYFEFTLDYNSLQGEECLVIGDGGWLGYGDATPLMGIGKEEFDYGTVEYYISEESEWYRTHFPNGDGKPRLTTTKVTLSGNDIVSGGNVTSDGGSPITARGICYGNFPSPDLSSTYSHTTDGSGTGYFTSTINSSATGTIYVRAYATNANGTTYGNEISVNVEYLRLPSFQYNGYTYRVAPDPAGSADEYINWNNANTYCENLTLYGHSNWGIPSVNVLKYMYQLRNTIGGFYSAYTSTSNTPCYIVYHSSEKWEYYYYVNWYNGQMSGSSNIQYSGYDCSNSDYCLVAHVRPVSIDWDN